MSQRHFETHAASANHDIVEPQTVDVSHEWDENQLRIVSHMGKVTQCVFASQKNFDPHGDNVSHNMLENHKDKASHYNKATQSSIVLLLFFFLFPVIFAIQIQEHEFVTIRPILEDMNKVDFNITIWNDLNESRDIDFNAWVNGTLIHSEVVSFDANELKELSFSWEESELAIVRGHYVVDVNLVDTNRIEFATHSFDFNVFRGKNLTILSLSTDRMNYKTGEVAQVKGIIINSGDLVASEDFNACYYLNGLLKDCVRILSLDIDQYYTFDANIQLFSTPQTNTITLVVDTEDEVPEFNENDNSRSIQVSTVSEVDLSVIADEISFDKAVAKEKMTFSITIRNLGGKTANNVDVKVFIGESEETGTIIYFNTFASFQGNSSRTITAYWTPYTEGYNVVNVVIDPLNKIEESNEGNNKAMRGFFVSPPAPEEEKAYTYILETQETCMALLSNNDRIILDGIVDLNDGLGVKVKVIDADGIERVNKTLKEDEEVNLPGRTLRVLNVESFFTRILLVYQEPVTMLYNTCQTDIKHEYERSQTYKKQRDECMQQKADCEARLNACITEKNSILSQQTNYQNLYEECLLAKERISNELMDARNECEKKILEEIVEAQKKKEAELKPIILQREAQLHEKAVTVDRLEKEIERLERTVTLAKYGFSIILFAVAGVFAYRHMQRSVKL
ncbi:MAG: CARDB domain-containing protein [Candidatus Baldrarchaeia archaeon]